MISSSAQITNIQVGRRALEKENFPNNWEQLNINRLVPAQNKTIFLFGGNTTTRPDAANGNAKIIKALLTPENDKNTSIYSFMYVTEPIKANSVLAKEYEQDTLILFQKTFKPLLFDANGNIKSKKGIEQVFNKMVFAAHCGGSCFVNIIIDEIYKTLAEHYPRNTAEQLTSKLQYFAYAPIIIPNHNVNSFFITPFNDQSYTWSAALTTAETSSIDVDYPKGITKTLLKARKQSCLREAFNSTFSEHRAIMLKSGLTTFFIPSSMNPRTNLGDHTIECIAKPQFLHSGTQFEQTAQLANFASKLYLNEFIKNNIIDPKRSFNRVTEAISNTSTSEQTA